VHLSGLARSLTTPHLIFVHARLGHPSSILRDCPIRHLYPLTLLPSGWTLVSVLSLTHSYFVVAVVVVLSLVHFHGVFGSFCLHACTLLLLRFDCFLLGVGGYHLNF